MHGNYRCTVEVLDLTDKVLQSYSDLSPSEAVSITESLNLLPGQRTQRTDYIGSTS